MLTRYKAWATGLLYRTLAKLPDETLSKPRRISFGSLLRTAHHVYAMDVVWKAHLEGSRHNYTTRNPELCPPLAELKIKQAEIDQWYVRYAESAPDLAQVIEFEFIGGNKGAMSREDILLHVVNHSTYHRGHIADMLHESGVSPPTTDLPVFLRHATPIELS